MYIQANIGRNAGPGPMGDTMWETFQRAVRYAIADTIDETTDVVGHYLLGQFQIHTGMGEWEGVAEESAHVSIYFDTRPGQVNAARVHEHLRDALADLAKVYSQDAIAFIVTDSHLATPGEV